MADEATSGGGRSTRAVAAGADINNDWETAAMNTMLSEIMYVTTKMEELAAKKDNDGSEADDDDCPICLEPLPPFWDRGRRMVNLCCGQDICKRCSDEKMTYLETAIAAGSFGRQEEQLFRRCSLCRTEKPRSDDAGGYMADRFEKGQLQLKLYAHLGEHYLNGTQGVEQSVERGMEILTLGAKKGDPMCQYRLGFKYDEGSDVPKSTAEAKRWYLAATEQGHAIAEHNLAVFMSDEGNDSEYLRYLKGSASKGCDIACYHLGVAYHQGDDKHGIEKSMIEAAHWLTPAAERNHALSMCLLGTAMCLPDPILKLPGHNPRFTKGVHFLRRAVAIGDQQLNEGQCEEVKRKLKVMEEWASEKCYMCNKKAAPQETFLRCSRCRAAWYCSKDCQAQHWRAGGAVHKQFCIKWGPPK